ncbi:MAG TPA: flagellar basal body-associated protein FliL [Pseudomonas sabulinigri]|jgi:flagellar FliL protein|uniref:Flagellar basal body-associated protein FliL n=1 Tax=marine sediment metagenome TaxID=412755 RepID=A0A0F9VT07_9ZZZZ|nr:flagellar basal body-associated protein FliL [Halopseudomonas sabulinigri]HEC52933.1 flagellar basal body-associated protein FliL [Halopseudomonas sabulinigri]|tara:strand:+ start:2818 stop:3330 length:513 start_codon:yes stop_codon:yes gene_type:complete
MAKQENNEVTEEVQEKPSNSRKKLFILIGVGLLALLLSAGGVAYFLLSGDDQEEVAQAPAEPVKQMALYQALEPPFVVNYSDNGRQRYMQVSVVLMGRSAEGMAKLNQHLPLIRNQLVLLFGSEEFAALLSPEGKEALRERAGLAVKALLEKEVGDPVIESVLFTNMVLQ